MGDKVLPFTRDRADRAPTEDIQVAQIAAAVNRGRASADRVIEAFEDIDALDRAYLRGVIARLSEVAEIC